MTRRLTLHIGAHKTGTTSLQRCFQDNAALLRTRGLAYVAGRNVPNLHGRIGPRDPDGLMPLGMEVRDMDSLVRDLTQAGGDHVLASSENFSFFFQPEPVEALARALRPHFDRIEILCYLRRQDRHALSHHQEGARPHRRSEAELWGNAIAALPDPAPQQAFYLDYDRRIGLWEQAFGHDALRLRVYDRGLLREGDVVADVLHMLDIPGDGLARGAEDNTALGALQAALGHAAHAAGLEDAVVHGLIAAAPPGPRALPARAAARAFLAPWRAGNARLNARFGLSDREFLFDDDFDDYPETATPDWSAAMVEQALALALTEPMKSAFDPQSVLSVEDLRDAAQALRRTRPDAALRLIEIALRLRPHGPMLRRLQREIATELAVRTP